MFAMGDWNATYAQTDRQRGARQMPPDRADRLHREQCAAMGMQPLAIGQLSTRPHTYTDPAPIDPTQHYTSRIDDVLTLTPGIPHAHPTEEQAVEMGGTLDHRALVLTVPFTTLPIPQPAAPKPTTKAAPTLKLPISQEQKQRTADAVAGMPGIHDLYKLATETRDRLVEAVEGHDDAPLDAEHTEEAVLRVQADRELMQSADVPSMAAQLTAYLADAWQIMLNTCDQNQPFCGRTCFKRTAQRRYEALVRRSRLLKQAKTHLMQPGTSMEDMPPHLSDAVHAALQEHRGEEQEITIIQRQIQRTSAEMDAHQKEAQKRKAKAHRAAFQRNLASRPRATHRRIFAAPKEAYFDSNCMALRNPKTGIVENEPERVVTAAHQFYQDLLQPEGHVKTGLYLPEHRTPQDMYPWEIQGAPDRFTLHRGQGTPSTGQADLLNLIMDRTEYDKKIQSLPRGKAAGPDEIPNELLQLLPPQHMTPYTPF